MGPSRTQWYSPRGARRGMLIAAIGAACWVSWAVGHVSAASIRIEAQACRALDFQEAGAAHFGERSL